MIATAGPRSTAAVRAAGAAQLAEIVRRIDAGEVTVDVSGRYPLADIARVWAEGAAGRIRGKVVITV